MLVVSSTRAKTKEERLLQVRKNYPDRVSHEWVKIHIGNFLTDDELNSFLGVVKILKNFTKKVLTYNFCCDNI